MEQTLFTKEQIQKRVGELAAQLASNYQGKQPVFIGILKIPQDHPAPNN